MNQPAPTFLFGEAAQSLTYDCPEGIPTGTATVIVQDDSMADTGAAEAATTGSVALDAATGVLSAAAGVGQDDPTAIPVDTTAAFVVGRRYLITSAKGWTEWFELLGKTATILYTRIALERVYAATTDTVKSPRLSIVLATDWVSSTAKLSGNQALAIYPWMSVLQADSWAQLSPRPRWRAEWRYTVGTVRRSASFFDVVRYELKHGVTAPDVDQLSRGWLYRVATEDRGGAEGLIAESLSQVKLDLWELEIAAYALRAGETVHELVKLKAIALVDEQAFAIGGIDERRMQLSAKRYSLRLEKLLGAKAKAQIQISPDGTGGQPPPAKLYER